MASVLFLVIQKKKKINRMKHETWKEICIWIITATPCIFFFKKDAFFMKCFSIDADLEFLFPIIVRFIILFFFWKQFPFFLEIWMHVSLFISISYANFYFNLCLQLLLHILWCAMWKDAAKTVAVKSLFNEMICNTFSFC